MQNFNDYDGLVDFPNRNILLNKIVNYLRLPFRNGQLVSLLMDMVYESKESNNELIINLDNNFNFLNNFLIKNNNVGNTNNGTNSISLNL